MTSSIVAKHVAILHHALGLTPERRTPYRNHYMAGVGHHSQAELLDLEAAGLMAQGCAPSFCEEGDMLFMCTEAGKAFALERLPLPPKRTKYDEYYHSESSLTFAEWLGIDVPRREQSYDYRTPNHFRLKSRRATGDYAPTLKEAKASYKAALAANRVQEKAWATGVQP